MNGPISTIPEFEPLSVSAPPPTTAPRTVSGFGPTLTLAEPTTTRIAEGSHPAMSPIPSIRPSDIRAENEDVSPIPVSEPIPDVPHPTAHVDPRGTTAPARFRLSKAKMAFVAVLGILALGTAGLKVFVGSAPTTHPTATRDVPPATSQETTPAPSGQVAKPTPVESVVALASDNPPEVVKESPTVPASSDSPAIPALFPAVNVEPAPTESPLPAPTVGTPEVQPIRPIAIPSVPEPKPQPEPKRLPPNIVSQDHVSTQTMPQTVVVPVPALPITPLGRDVQAITPPNVVPDPTPVPPIITVDAKGPAIPAVPVVPVAPTASQVPSVPLPAQTMGLPEPGGLTIPSITPAQKETKQPTAPVPVPPVVEAPRPTGIPAPAVALPGGMALPEVVMQKSDKPKSDTPPIPKPAAASGLTVPNVPNLNVPSAGIVAVPPATPPVVPAVTTPPASTPVVPTPSKITVAPVSPAQVENRAVVGTPTTVQPVSLPESPSTGPSPTPRTIASAVDRNKPAAGDVPPEKKSPAADVPMSPKAITQVANEAPPRTDYDVDLHTPRAGESFEAISRQHYGDAKYSEALRAFNAGRTPGTGAPIQVPPIYVLRKHFPQLLDAKRPAPSVYPNAPTSAPRSLSLEPGNRTSDVQWAPASRGSQPGTYSVPRAGMRLWDIAEELYGDRRDWQRVWRANPQLDPNSVLPTGTQIRVP
ncbi:MAG: hypothetical protein LC104_22025 [Bacteroidales bacterium]|nr:hypothetical protein [Bacteroidales bacterium]